MHSIEEYWINYNDKNIFGLLYKPEKDGKLPLIIMCHGYGSWHRENTKEAEKLAEEYIVYTFDFYGGGPEIKSDGTMLDMSVLSEAEDLNAVIDNLKELEFVDKNNIILCGKSQGGFVASFVSSNRPDIKCLINYYPGYVIRDYVNQAKEYYGYIPETAEVLGYTISNKYSLDALKVDIYEEIKKYNGNVLIIHGDKDTLVPIEYSYKAIECFKKAELKIIEGGVHDFKGHDREIAMGYLEEFIKANIV